MQQVSEKEKQLQEIFGLFANLQDTDTISNEPSSKFNKEKQLVVQRQQGKIFAKTIPIILRHLGQIPPDYEEIITELINFKGDVENDPGEIQKILQDKEKCKQYENIQLDYDDFMIIHSKLNKVPPPTMQQLKEALLTLAKEINDSQGFDPPLKYMPDPKSQEPKKPFLTKASPGKIKAFDFKRVLTTMCDKMTPEEVDELLAKIPSFQRFSFENQNNLDIFDYQYEREEKEEEKKYLQEKECELDIDQIVEVLTRVPIDPLSSNS